MRWPTFGRKQLTILAGLLSLSALTLMAAVQLTSAAASEPLVTHPLTNLSNQQIAQYALAYTHARYRAVTGVPDAPLVRRVTTADLPTLGLDQVHFGCGEPPLVFVLVRGDLDVSAGAPHWTGAQRPVRVDHIGYVFDMYKGVPAVHAFGGLNVSRLLGLTGGPGPQPSPRPAVAVASPVPTPKPSWCNGGYFPGWATPPSVHGAGSSHR